ncbi:hypothetical protein [Thermomonospora umbrina]|uniref:Uncharacterized protein n=1 Tax=Thermomonospora umbrina TaxID=111806 RepID=A0A3D9SYG6_9ACTN|nr:hypothetical protein [Thermomonospora umbrina]REF00618.1 hypothetical protein DFJ69_6174 [Thermomonospora umbrina]
MWVRLQRIYPTTSPWPQEATTPLPCSAGGAWAAELVMGVYRCVAAVDDNGDPATCEQVFNDAEKLLSDAAAMRQAALCCFPATEEGPDVLAGEYRPIGPNGGCGGGQMLVTVRFTECCPTP